MKDMLIIIGASGHGKVVADIALKIGNWKTIKFLDDNESIRSILNFQVVGTTKEVISYIDQADFFVAIGNNNTRESIFYNLIQHGCSVVTLVHPDSTIGLDVEIGVGSVVMAGVVINSSTKIGNGCIVNTSSSIDHDNVIGDFTHISPGVHIAGSTKIGKNTWLGIGCTVSNNLSICDQCKVGAGSLVLNDIKDSGTYVGVPVRRLY